MPNYNPVYTQQQGYMPQQQGYMPQQQELFLIRSVGSPEEAIATPGDYFKPTIILGLNHDMIYYKKFNPETGETIFDAYKRAPEALRGQQYVTVDQFEQFNQQFDQFKNAVAQAINQLRGVDGHE